MNLQNSKNSPKFLIVGSHPELGQSMNRYSKLLREAYTASPYNYRLISPTNSFSKRFSNEEVKKWLTYFESYIVFLPKLLLLSAFSDYVHYADQGQSLSRFLINKHKLILTCHDLFGLEASLGLHNNVNTRLSGLIFQKLVNRKLYQNRIITISNFSRNQIKVLLEIEFVTVIYLPLQNKFCELGVRRKSEPTFALIVMNATWRKQRFKSIELWKKIYEEDNTIFPKLVIIGEPLTLLEKEILGESLIVKVNTLQGICDEELKNMYSECSALIHLANLEGFGWPIIEANSQGTIAIFSTQNKVGAEIYDNSNIAIDPDAFKVKSLARSLDSSEVDRRALSKRTIKKYHFSNFENDLVRFLSELE